MGILRSKRFTVLIAAAVVAILAQPVAAQFSDSYNFLKAVEDRKGEDVDRFINEPGSGAVIINTRRDGTGETALHIVTARRDEVWLTYLLAKGANPNIADRRGNTPLMLATQLGFAEGAEQLIKYKAAVDAANRSGETALIRAVQLRNADMVRLLVRAGANPDKRDTVAGLSAREYAMQDGRNSSILGIIERGGKADEDKKPAELDFSGIGEPK